uniref:Uncharacterized protein n=1 Tax=Arundo donax TaxID=35708 RepID=A0A0A8Z8P2_ARUDO
MVANTTPWPQLALSICFKKLLKI